MDEARGRLDHRIGGRPRLHLDEGRVFELRAGYEMYGIAYGLEVGPALVVGPGKTHFALNFTPWLGGVFVDPYLTLSLGIGGPSRTEVGSYLKLPICLHDDDGCYSGGSGGHGWD